MALRFGECELDPERYELRRRGEVVHVEPKVFDVLDYLMRQRERVVTKRELLDALWPGEVVSDSVLSRAI
nr:winged helix-turn-helix domain-containing protein [Myxococcota bacterium]